MPVSLSVDELMWCQRFSLPLEHQDNSVVEWDSVWSPRTSNNTS